MRRPTAVLRRHLGGRLLVLCALALALFPPPLPWSRAALHLVVLVDESLSMPRDFTDEAWQQLRATLAEAPANSRLQLLRFAAQPTQEPVAEGIPEKLPRTMVLDRTSTNIASALQQALHLLPAARPAVMVLVSDLAATHGDTGSALQSVHRADIPIYLLAPGPGAGGSLITLRDLQLPARVNAGDEVAVVAVAESASAGKVTASLRINGQLADQREIALVAAERTPVAFHFAPRVPGVQLITVQLGPISAIDGDDPHLVQQTRAVNVQGHAPLLYVTRRLEPGPLVASFRSAGWAIAAVSPDGLMAQTSLLARVGAIMLDDIAIGDMNESTWNALVNSVQVEGKGLAVLGGPHSFGAGGYRHSRLEQILPVTAEAADPQTPAAVMFLLDRSGSMGRAQAGPSRFAQARQAVAASVKMLLPDDLVGIITFATDAETRLQLAAGQRDGTDIFQALDVEPGGGTRLGTALQLAEEQLRTIDVDRKLIVLVTDGFTGDEDLEAIAQELRKQGITVIALAVGADANLAGLAQLAKFNNGRVLPVSNAVTLPGLMAETVATQRAPAVSEATLPQSVQALPFPLDTAAPWPPLSGYMVTRARDEAEVYLQSDRGDPLFATRLAGAGRVAVLPAGLGQWADAWWSWPGIGALIGGLGQWLDRADGAENISLLVDDEPGVLRFGIDLQLAGGWNSGALPRLLVDDPAGTRTALTPALNGPGHYTASMAAHLPGLYQATLQAGDQTLRHAVYRDADRESSATEPSPRDRARWLEQGWLQAWPGGKEVLAKGPRDTSGSRRALLVLALFSYLLVLVLERRLPGSWARSLRARFSR